MEYFHKILPKRLSFTDAASIAIMKLYRINYIMSFNKHFNGIVPRIG